MKAEKPKWRILVTGGAGFIGSNFILYMISKYPSYRIINFDALTYAGNLENLKTIRNHPNYKFVKGNILDSRLINETVKDCDAIVHFAAESHVDRSLKDSTKFAATNVTGTEILLEAAKTHNLKRFHHVSTIEVFGGLGPGDKLISEKTPYNPTNPYASLKAGSDYSVKSYLHTYQLPITISHCTNNYGPRQFPEKFIPLAITNLIRGKKVPLYGDGRNRRDWLYVEDHCRAIDLILHRGKIGESYCVGSGQERTNIEIVNLLAKMLGRGGKMIRFVKDRPSHERRYAMNASKIKRGLGWKPKVDFEEGLKLTVQWYQKNQNWWRRKTKPKPS